jgi:hypothetical protein
MKKALIITTINPKTDAIDAFATLPVEKLQKGKSVVGILALPKFTDTDIPTLKKTLLRKTLLFLQFA